MEIILIRHANSMANARLTSNKNSDLTELGEKQVECTANFLEKYLKKNGWYSEKGVDCHKIISSPYKRAYKTASVIALKTGFKLMQTLAIGEIVQSCARFRKEDFPLVINKNMNWIIKRGESNLEFMRRIDDFTDSFYSDSYKSIVVSHGVPIQRMCERFKSRNREKLDMTIWDSTVRNCSISHFKITSLENITLLDKYTKHLEKEGLLI